MQKSQMVLCTAGMNGLKLGISDNRSLFLHASLLSILSVWIHDTFENNFEIKHKLEKYLKESF